MHAAHFGVKLQFFNSAFSITALFPSGFRFHRRLFPGHYFFFSFAFNVYFNFKSAVFCLVNAFHLNKVGHRDLTISLIKLLLTQILEALSVLLVFRFIGAFMLYLYSVSSSLIFS